MEVFRKVCCPRPNCGKPHYRVRAKTISGAMRRIAQECDGIIQTKEGPVATICATGVVDTGE